MERQGAALLPMVVLVLLLLGELPAKHLGTKAAAPEHPPAAAAARGIFNLPTFARGLVTADAGSRCAAWCLQQHNSSVLLAGAAAHEAAGSREGNVVGIELGS
jgi:hypothetical protein